jgi:hypothetical protein
VSRAFFATAVAVALFCLASPAAAQTAVLFPVGGDAELASAHGAEVIERVTRDFEESSFTVLAGPALAQAMTAAHADACEDPSCAGPMLAALTADLGVGVALWHRSGLVQVSVVLVDPHGVLVSADADGAESVLGQATQSALSQARARWATRAGSPVRVLGTPEGATITVDHEPWGTLPHEGSLSPGTHHFVVSADGHVTERREVEIAAATESLELRFELVAGTDSAVTPPAGGGDPAPVLVGVGVAAAVVGAGLLAWGIGDAVDSTRCTAGCAGPASGRTIHIAANELGIGMAIAGGVALAIGVVLVAIGATPANAGGAPVALTGDGLAVSF